MMLGQPGRVSPWRKGIIVVTHQLVHEILKLSPDIEITGIRQTDEDRTKDVFQLRLNSETNKGLSVVSEGDMIPTVDLEQITCGQPPRP